MIWVFSATMFFVGLILFGYGYKRNDRRPPALKLHLLNEEVVGVILMLIGIWTIAVYALVKLN